MWDTSWSRSGGASGSALRLALMARTVARMRLLDAVLVAAVSHGVDAFDGDFQRWCQINKVSRSTAYRHKQRIQVEGLRLPPNRGGIDYKESHAGEAEEVRR